eukprot:896321-Rhodomonas_salina.1
MPLMSDAAMYEKGEGVEITSLLLTWHHYWVLRPRARHETCDTSRRFGELKRRCDQRLDLFAIATAGADKVRALRGG